MGIYRGFLVLNKEKQNTSGQLIKLISGGEEMKYQGISIIKHKNCNTWYARYRAGGKQFYVSARTQQQCYDKLKEALKQKSKLQIKQIKEPKQKHIKKTTLSEWFKKWVELYKQNVKYNTRLDYDKSFKYLTPLHNKELDSITTIEILELLNKIQYERRKQIVYDLLKALYDKAILNEVATKNPMLKIEKPKHIKINGLALSNEDEKILENILISDSIYDIYLVCLYQGLRKGEVLALTSDDINFEKMTLTINKALSSTDEIDTTKNVYSNRVMPLFEKTKNVLLKYKNTLGRIFTGQYRYSDQFFARVIKQNFPNTNYTMHSLRHTFITRCQEAGIPLHIIQKWVGHVNGSSVTNKVYTHIRENAEAENIEVLNKILNSN